MNHETFVACGDARDMLRRQQCDLIGLYGKLPRVRNHELGEAIKALHVLERRLDRDCRDYMRGLRQARVDKLLAERQLSGNTYSL